MAWALSNSPANHAAIASYKRHAPMHSYVASAIGSSGPRRSSISFIVTRWTHVFTLVSLRAGARHVLVEVVERVEGIAAVGTSHPSFAELHFPSSAAVYCARN